MKLRLIGMGAAMASALAMAAAASAQPRGEWMHGHGGFGMEFLHGLNLTDEQKTEIHDIEKSAWASMIPLMEKMRAAHEAEINALLGTGTVTAESLRPTIAQEELLRQQMDALHLDSLIKMRSVLTADQLATAATRHAQMEQLHQQEHALMTGEESPQ